MKRLRIIPFQVFFLIVGFIGTPFLDHLHSNHSTYDYPSDGEKIYSHDCRGVEIHKHLGPENLCLICIRLSNSPLRIAHSPSRVNLQHQQTLNTEFVPIVRLFVLTPTHKRDPPASFSFS